MTQREPHRIVVVGASLVANKGAGAMLEAALARVPEVSGPCRFDVLSTYPTRERQLLYDRDAVTVGDLRPVRLAALEFPLAVVAAVARRLRIPLRFVPASAVGRAYRDADLVIDLAGISFADGRGVPTLLYNTLMTGIGLLHGVPTVKAAQALGTFDETATRLAARAVLPRLAWIGARGRSTYENLMTLELTNVEEVADLAFSLPAADEAAVTGPDVARPRILVFPSSVVRRLCARSGIDYVDRMAALIRDVRRRTGREVVIAPHSYREGEPEGRMNDGPVCRDLAAALADDDGVEVVDADLDPAALRRLVAGSDLLLTSRFHGMIAGLAECVPVVVVGWSHKYREVLAEFDLTSLGCDHRSLEQPTRVADLAVEAFEERDAVSAQIAAALPSVVEQSARNFAAIDQILRKVPA